MEYLCAIGLQLSNNKVTDIMRGSCNVELIIIDLPFFILTKNQYKRTKRERQAEINYLGLFFNFFDLTFKKYKKCDD